MGQLEEMSRNKVVQELYDQFVQPRVQVFVEGMVTGVYRAHRRFNEIAPEDFSELEAMVKNIPLLKLKAEVEEEYEHSLPKTSEETLFRYKLFDIEHKLQLMQVQDDRETVKALSYMFEDVKNRRLSSGDNAVDYENFNSVLRILKKADSNLYEWNTAVDIEKLRSETENLRARIHNRMDEHGELSDEVVNELYAMENELVTISKQAGWLKTLMPVYRGELSLSVIAEAEFEGDVPDMLKEGLGVEYKDVQEEGTEEYQVGISDRLKGLGNKAKGAYNAGNEKLQVHRFHRLESALGFYLTDMDSQTAHKVAAKGLYHVLERTGHKPKTAFDVIDVFGSLPVKYKTVTQMGKVVEEFLEYYDPNIVSQGLTRLSQRAKDEKQAYKRAGTMLVGLYNFNASLE